MEGGGRKEGNEMCEIEKAGMSWLKVGAMGAGVAVSSALLGSYLYTFIGVGFGVVGFVGYLWKAKPWQDDPWDHI
jgi:hypothetical protein